MAENDELDPLNNPEGENPLDEEAQAEQTKIDGIIENLLTNIDLPGDKEIDRAPAPGIDEEESVEDEGDVLGDGTYYQAGEEVDYSERPELKTDKRRRITVDDLDSLFSDYERTISGGKAGDEPIFGKEVEPEKRVEDDEELQAQKLATQKLQGPVEGRQDPGDLSEEITPEDEEFDMEGLDLTDEVESPIESEGFDTDESADKVEETQGIEEPLEEDDFSLGDIDIEQDIETEDQKVEVQSEASAIDELKLDTDESEAEDFSFGDIDFEEDTFQPEESLDSVNTEDLQEMSTDDTIEDKVDQEALEDIDEKIHEEESYIPDLAFDDVASEEENVAPNDFDDLDQYIEDSEDPSRMKDEPVEAIDSQMADTSVPSEPEAIVESEFDDLVPLDKDFDTDEAGRSTLKELEGESIPVSDEFYSIPDMESIEDESVFEDPETSEDVVTTSQSSETKIAETLIEEPAKESQSMPKEEAIQEPDTLEAGFDDFDLPEMETPSEIEKTEASPQTQELEPALSQTQEPIIDEVSPEELQFTDEEQEIILGNLKKLPEPLSTIATDTIIQEKLPINDINFLTQKLIHNPIPSDIKNFLEDRLGITIPLRETGRPRAVKREAKAVKLGALGKLAIAAMLIASVGLGLWFLALRPYFQKQDNMEKAVAQIQGGIQPYSPKDMENINLQNVINQAIEDNDINALNRFAEEFIKMGNPKALYNAHKLLLGNDPNNKLLNKDSNSQNPGAEESYSIDSFKGIIDFKDPNKDFEGVISIDPSNKKTLFLIVEMYSQKAIWASRFNPADVKTYCSKAENLLEKEGQDDIEIVNHKAQVYILCGNLIGKENRVEMERKYRKANDLYHYILSKEPDNAKGLYGRLEIYLAQMKSLTQGDIKDHKAKIKSVYNSIEKANLLDDNLNKKVLSEYAFYLYKQIDKKLNNTQAFRTEQKVMKILSRVIEGKGPIYPKAYYYQGLLFQERDPKRSLDSYIRGLLSYYALKKKSGEEELNKKMDEGDTPEEQVKIREKMFIEIRDKVIIPDTDLENKRLQSKFFNNIGENYLVLSKDFRASQDTEREKRQILIKAATKNFDLAIEKDPMNYKPWKNRGDLSYSRKVNRFIKDPSGKSNKDPEKFKDAKLNYLIAVILLVKEKSMGKVNLFKVLDDKVQKYLVKLVAKQNQGSVDLQDFYKIVNINTLRGYLADAQDQGQVDPQLFYKIGYIFYYEEQYRLARDFWSVIQGSQDTNWEFNPVLNYSLGNSYLKIGQNEAIRNYKKIIAFYEDRVSLYRRNLDLSNPEQIKVFKRLAYAHNNLGVSYHLGEDEDQARYHYYKGSQYASKLNLKDKNAELGLNILIINKNKIIEDYKKVRLMKGRKTYPLNPRIPKVNRLQWRVIYPGEVMMIDDLEEFLKG